MRRHERQRRTRTREEQPTGTAIHTAGRFTFVEFTYRGQLSEWTRTWDPRLTLTRRDQIGALQEFANGPGQNTPVGHFTRSVLFDQNLWTRIEDFLGEPPLRAYIDLTDINA